MSKTHCVVYIIIGNVLLFSNSAVSNGVYVTADSVIIEGTYLPNSLGLVIFKSPEEIFNSIAQASLKKENAGKMNWAASDEPGVLVYIPLIEWTSRLGNIERENTGL